MNLSAFKKIHFIGIGGIGMSGLARHFLAEGKAVVGSDRSSSPITEALQDEGVVFFSPQSAENIASDVDMVVYTEAMSHDHPEMIAAHSLGVPMMNYFEALGLVANDYFQIAVAGAHGKTTTTAMLIDIFEDAGLDPSAVVGSLRTRTGKNYRRGKSKFFIVEACEYKRDFLHLRPDVLVITNIEAEHLDYYKDLDDVVIAFNELARKVSEEGYVVCNTKDPITMRMLHEVRAAVVDYTDFIDLFSPMKQPGMHNRMNAAAAVAAAIQCGIPKEDARKSVQEFSGTWRRFEYKGVTKKGAVVYDDYGHHPSEVAATLAGAYESYPDKKIHLIFQPHMYSRTHALFDDFVDVLKRADRVTLLPIYAAREENLSGVTSEKLAEHMGVTTEAVATFEEAVVRGDEAGGDTVLVIMGAGDVYKIAEKLVVTK